MKIEKNKIVFGAVIVVILLFIISYSLLILDDKENDTHLKQTLVPELEQEAKEYDSKLDAVNDLKEVRESNAPSIYDEKLIDSLGYYDTDLSEKEKERMIDSIYESGRIKYSEEINQGSIPEPKSDTPSSQLEVVEIENEQKIEAKEIGLEHQLFFASSPASDKKPTAADSYSKLYAVVDGDQVVKAASRIRMRLTDSAWINGIKIPKNTLVYGFVSFQPNRTLVTVENIDHYPVDLKAFDIQDGSEGIYVENSFRAEATNEVLDDIIQDINIPSMPQVNGITKVLKRNNRNVKVIVLNNYKLILKPKL